MLKRSLLAVAILGAFVATAGANTEGVAEKVQPTEKPQLELVLDVPEATCGATKSDILSQADLQKLLERYSSAQLEKQEVAWGRIRGPRLCIMCSAWVCYTVPC
jgi:hypothetical protein